MAKRSIKINVIFLIMSCTGLSITTVLNLMGIYLLNQPAALFFSQGWWSTWFSSYLIWFVFLIISFGLKMSKTRG